MYKFFHDKFQKQSSQKVSRIIEGQGTGTSVIKYLLMNLRGRLMRKYAKIASINLQENLGQML